MPPVAGTAIRARSPAGGSTLTTDAPRSLRIFTQCGPARTRVKSTTVQPSSGAATSGPTEDAIGHTAGEEGGEAGGEIVAVPYRPADLGRQLVSGEHAVRRGVVGQALDGLVGDRGPGGQLAGQRQAGVAQSLVGHDLVDQAPALQRRRPVPAAEQDDLLGPGQTG